MRPAIFSQFVESEAIGSAAMTYHWRSYPCSGSTLPIDMASICLSTLHILRCTWEFQKRIVPNGDCLVYGIGIKLYNSSESYSKHLNSFLVVPQPIHASFLRHPPIPRYNFEVTSPGYCFSGERHTCDFCQSISLAAFSTNAVQAGSQ